MGTNEWEQWSSREKSASSNQAAVTNGGTVVEFLGWCETVRHRAPSTVRAYGSVLSMYVDFIGHMDICAVEVDVMEAFMTRPRVRRAKGSTGAAATQHKDAAILHSFYRFLYERGYTQDDRSKALHSPTVHNANPRPVGDADWVKLWEYAQDLSDSSIAALGLGYTAGLRRHEIQGLKVEQVTPSKLVNFPRKGGGDHTLPWSQMMGILTDGLPQLFPHVDRFQVALARLVRGRKGGERLLRWPQTNPDAMNKRMVRWCSEAGIDQLTPHQLRHSAVTNLLRCGVPLHLTSRLANHSNVATTMLYVRAGGDELGEWRAARKGS